MGETQCKSHAPTNKNSIATMGVKEGKGSLSPERVTASLLKSSRARLHTC